MGRGYGEPIQRRFPCFRSTASTGTAICTRRASTSTGVALRAWPPITCRSWRGCECREPTRGRDAPSRPVPSRPGASALSHDRIAQDADVRDLDLHDVAVLDVLRRAVRAHPEHVARVERQVLTHAADELAHAENGVLDG